MGAYLSLDVIIDGEGGASRPSAVRAGLTYVRRCLSMQGAWVSYNHMTERTEYLYMRR